MDIPVMLSRIAGIAIVITGLALGWKYGLSTGDDSWTFLSIAVLPVACGVLIIVAAEILLRLGSSNRKSR